MSISPEMQLQQLAAAVLIGFLIEILWELVGSFSDLQIPILSPLTEMLFLAGCLSALFVFGQALGRGQLRLFMLVATAGGFVLAKSFIGRKLRSIFTFAGKRVRETIVFLLSPLKKVENFFKILYANLKNWFTIIDNQKEGTDTKKPSLRRRKKISATGKVSDCHCFDGADSLRKFGSHAGCSSASSSGEYADSASDEGSGVEPSYSGVTIRYE